MVKTGFTSRLCGVLAAAFVAVAIAAVPAFAVDSTTNPYAAAYAGGVYTDFGDSISAGYSVELHPDTIGFQVAEGSYPNRLAKALGMTESPCSCIGFRTNEILRALGVDVESDYYYEHFQDYGWSSLDWAEITSRVTESVENSGLITIGISSNDVMTVAIINAAYVVAQDSGKLTDEVKAEIEEIFADGCCSAEMLDKMLSLMEELDEEGNYYTELLYQMGEGMDSFEANLPKIIERIKALNNGKGAIMVVGTYNPFINAVTTIGNVQLPIGRAFNLVTESMNSFMRRNAEKYGYTFVNVSDTETYLSAMGTVEFGVDKVESQEYDVHPTAAGNEYIAQNIVNALPERAADTTTTVYRLYNPITSEHLWTTNFKEYLELTAYDWVREGAAWSSPKDGVAVYRLYNAGLGTHLYTSNLGEIEELTSLYGWSNEGISFYSAEDKETGEPMEDAVGAYRLYNDGLSQHLLTSNKAEYDALPASGWTQEDVAFYVFAK